MNNLPPPRISKLPPPRKIATPVVAEMQGTLFDMEEDWMKEWKGMPEFKQEDLSPAQAIIINFVSYTDVKRFAKLIGQRLTVDVKSIWFPKSPIDKVILLRYVDTTSNRGVYKSNETQVRSQKRFREQGRKTLIGGSTSRYQESLKGEGIDYSNPPTKLPDDIEAKVIAYEGCEELLK